VHYNAGTGPVVVQDAKTIVLKQMTLQANKAPGVVGFI